jgi:hypothetical protein
MNSPSFDADFAKELAKYADVITGFALAQVLLFGYSLGKKDELARSILEAKPLITRANIALNTCYGLCVILLGIQEFKLRSATHQPHIILSTVTVLIVGRLLTLTLAFIIGHTALKKSALPK